MDPSIIAAIIGAGASVTTAGAMGVASGKMNKRAEKFNREEAANQRAFSEYMANKQNAWNTEFWERANAYDSPTAQMERLREAGLNPLYFGLDGNQSQAAPEAAQPLGYERAVAPNYRNPVGDALDAAAKVAQISNIQADTAKKNNENLTETQRREQIITSIDETKQNIKLKLSQEDLNKTQRETLEKQLDWIDRINEAVIKEKESNTSLNQSQKKRIDELLEGEKEIQNLTMQDFQKRWDKIEAEISKIAGENALLREDLINYAINHSSNGVFGTGISVQNLMRWFSDPDNKNKDGNWQNKKQRELSNKPDQPIIQR